jgi:hypothetical protein
MTKKPQSLYCALVVSKIFTYHFLAVANDKFPIFESASNCFSSVYHSNMWRMLPKPCCDRSLELCPFLPFQAMDPPKKCEADGTIG